MFSSTGVYVNILCDFLSGSISLILFILCDIYRLLKWRLYHKLPLQAITISPEYHVSVCLSRTGDSELEECPDGVSCLSTDVFHYRDYQHKLLAEYRASSDFVPPEIEIKPSPRKKKSPQKPYRRSTPRKKTLESNNTKKLNQKDRVNDNNAVHENDSDSEVLVPRKKPRRSLKFSENPVQTPQPSKERSETVNQICDKNVPSEKNKENESITQGSMSEKKLQKTRNDRLDSSTTVQSCSGCPTESYHSLMCEASNDSNHITDHPISPEVQIFQKKPSHILSSSLVLQSCGRSICSPAKSNSSLVCEDNNDSNHITNPPSSPEVNILQKKPSHLLSSSSDSNIPLFQKLHLAFNDVTKIKGKVKPGKVLLNSNKTPINLNGLSLNGSCINTEINASDRESETESGKSLVFSDVSFVPSEKSSSTFHTVSGNSVCNTDQLTASSASSTVSFSSECYTESRSSDPSYSEDCDISPGTRLRKTRKSMKPLTTLSEEFTNASSCSTSEISMREKLLFGNKKLSPKKILSKNSKVSTNVKKPLRASTLRLLDTSDSDDKSEWRSLVNRMRNRCYPSDLKIDSEDTLTTVSSCSGSDTSQATALLPPRQCPFYKRIPDTPFAVDAFQYWNIPGVKIYFLSHFHSDHYIGLKKSFSHPIYCTQITANLVRMKLRVEQKWLRTMDLNQPQIISGVEVTALDANHCPGSVMFLFSLTNGRSYLHVGDFRASRAMTFYPSLKMVSITKLFLDTTYCSPQYCFPTQEEVIAKVVEIVRNHVKNHPKTLVVCGSYTIGKEKVFLGIAEALDWQIWARPEKQRVFSCLNDPRINSRLVKDFRHANVHVLPMASLQIRNLSQHLQICMGTFSHVIGIKPTGWELNTRSDQFKVTSRDNITIHGVPYSEHSSFTELRDFVQFLQPHEVVATVNVGNSASRAKMNKYFSDWLTPTTQLDGKSEKQTKVSQYFKTNSQTHQMCT